MKGFSWLLVALAACADAIDRAGGKPWIVRVRTPDGSLRRVSFGPESEVPTLRDLQEESETEELFLDEACTAAADATATLASLGVGLRRARHGSSSSEGVFLSFFLSRSVFGARDRYGTRARARRSRTAASCTRR